MRNSRLVGRTGHFKIYLLKYLTDPTHWLDQTDAEWCYFDSRIYLPFLCHKQRDYIEWLRDRAMKAISITCWPWLAPLLFSLSVVNRLGKDTINKREKQDNEIEPSNTNSVVPRSDNFRITGSYIHNGQITWITKLLPSVIFIWIIIQI